MMTLVVAALLMPPAQYDHEPTRPYELHYASSSAIATQCRCLDVMVAQLTHPDAHALGCTDLGTFDIWIDNSLSPALTAKVLRHEKAHVNGWRHH